MITLTIKGAFNFFSLRKSPYSANGSLLFNKTSEVTHKIIRENLDKSPMYQGMITGIGPRYCPSIEDKVVRFAHKPIPPYFYRT